MLLLPRGGKANFLQAAERRHRPEAKYVFDLLEGRRSKDLLFISHTLHPSKGKWLFPKEGKEGL